MDLDAVLRDVEMRAASREQRAVLRAIAAEVGRLEGLSVSELDVLDVKAQAVFHDLLLASPPGAHRDALFQAAYSVVPAILLARRRLLAGDTPGFGIGRATVDRVLGFLRKPRSRVVDVGCSSGFLVSQLLAHGHDAFGIELSEELVETGRQRLEELGHSRDRLICGDFLHLDSTAISGLANADLIWSNDVLEHFHPDDAWRFFSQAKRLLAPGGVLWVVTPSRLTQTSRKTLHLKQYYLHELLDMARSAGFSSSSARLLASRRAFLWPLNVPTSASCRAKLAVETILRRLPRKVGSRIARSMAFSEVFLGG